MQGRLVKFAKRYATALGSRLEGRVPAGGHARLKLGTEALNLGLETLELARIHEQACASLKPLKRSGSRMRMAEAFFAEVMGPVTASHSTAKSNKEELGRVTGALKHRTRQLTRTNRMLARSIQRRKGSEAAFKRSNERFSRLLSESNALQGELRRLLHLALKSQEEERTKSHRELQNEIAQTLVGINLRLASLRIAARNRTRDLNKAIAQTQELVKVSSASVTRVRRKERKE